MSGINKRGVIPAVTAAGFCILFVGALIIGALLTHPGVFSARGEEKPDEVRDSLISVMISEGREIAGVYVASVGNINYPEKQGLSDRELISGIDSIIATCLKAGLNTIVFQVRPASDSLYRSTVFPSSAYVTGIQGKAPGVDILAKLVERAHTEGIAVIAWVNPLRVVKGAAFALSPSNPASVHPEYTVTYAGTVMFDPGIPEVRALVARGCAEIAAGYDVDGILFDDYFYPYPSDGERFEDDLTYTRYGEGKPIDVWRRNNVDSLVKESYDAIKSVRPECLFGIAPFGIWSNDDGKNGGSDTRGLDAYNEIFCDALAWAEGGYVDFLAPQIYWSFDHPSAPYGVLAKWWSEKLGSTDVALLSSNAAYKVSEWSDPEELKKQVEFCREVGGYAGCLFYSYAAFRDDERDIISCISSAFSE